MGSRFRDPNWKRPFNDRGMVREPYPDDDVLKPAKYDDKLGGDFQPRGEPRWPSLYLCLEEYGDSCDPDCSLLINGECYGNNSFFDRFVETDTNLFWPIVDRQLRELNANHWRFFVRLHCLGDFKDVRYVNYWRARMRQFPSLNIWGTSSKSPDSEKEAARVVGQAIAEAMNEFPTRWGTQFSNRFRHDHATHIFDRQELASDENGKPKAHQSAFQAGEEFRYFLCPEQVDSVTQGKLPGEKRTCSTCMYCLGGGNVGWIKH